MKRRMTFPETTMLKLPAGTLDRVHAAAEREGAKPAEIMRRAVVAAVGFTPRANSGRTRHPAPGAAPRLKRKGPGRTRGRVQGLKLNGSRIITGRDYSASGNKNDTVFSQRTELLPRCHQRPMLN